ncbi:CiaD-like domain-containing protein [Sulfuricurvum sp.]|uniref:CiaD-like domain-containing protein n=1 Tax=Sulfuricurvum sp. TaxID=2025608 RepID=UPI003BAF6275
MELKDVILSTLAEIEELSTLPEPLENIGHPKEEIPLHEEPIKNDHPVVETIHTVRDDEARMLEGIRERLLVLFEGFQSPNNVQIEAKVDLTLNFLEYLLATIDHRLDTIK